MFCQLGLAGAFFQKNHEDFYTEERHRRIENLAAAADERDQAFDQTDV
jgi:hypothetical protein